MNKPVYLGLSILELSKIVLNKFWYGYLKPKYGQKTFLNFVISKFCNIKKNCVISIQTAFILFT